MHEFDIKAVCFYYANKSVNCRVTCSFSSESAQEVRSWEEYIIMSVMVHEPVSLLTQLQQKINPSGHMWCLSVPVRVPAGLNWAKAITSASRS